MSTVQSSVKITRTRFCYGDESEQFGDLYMPEFSGNMTCLYPVIILIHGGYWKDNHSLDSYATSHLIPSLVGFGAAVWNIEYRRMDSVGENLKAPWPVVFEDVGMAVDFLPQIAKKKCLDLTSVTVIGHSAGGCLALWAASRRQIPNTSSLYRPSPLNISRAMSIGGILSLAHSEDLAQPEQIFRLMGGRSADHPDRYRACDPKQLRDPSVSIVVIHGEKDATVLVHQAETYAKKDPANVELEVWPDADHFSMLPHDGVWSHIQWQRLKDRIRHLIGT